MEVAQRRQKDHAYSSSAIRTALMRRVKVARQDAT
jgi:hypothetical protein